MSTRDAPPRAHATFTRAAGGLVHPVPILAIVVLVLNDHWWKRAFGSWLTGKLSDVAGLVFFPLLLEAVLELVARARGRYEGPSIHRLVVTIAVTLVGFVAVKSSAYGADAYGVVLGVARWPFSWAIARLQGTATPALDHPDIVRDPSDLLALVGLVAAYFVGCARTRDHLRAAAHSNVG